MFNQIVFPVSRSHRHTCTHTCTLSQLQQAWCKQTRLETKRWIPGQERRDKPALLWEEHGSRIRLYHDKESRRAESQHWNEFIGDTPDSVCIDGPARHLVFSLVRVPSRLFLGNVGRDVSGVSSEDLSEEAEQRSFCLQGPNKGQMGASSPARDQAPRTRSGIGRSTGEGGRRWATPQWNQLKRLSSAICWICPVYNTSVSTVRMSR